MGQEESTQEAVRNGEQYGLKHRWDEELSGKWIILHHAVRVVRGEYSHIGRESCPVDGEGR